MTSRRTLLVLALFLTAACSGHGATGTPAVPLPTLKGTATLLGQTDWSGTKVSIAGTSLSDVTAADGTWKIANAPLGLLTLDFSNGALQTSLTTVLTFTGSNGFLISDNGLYPLSPMDVPRATQLASGSALVFAADGGAILRATAPDGTVGDEVVAAATGATFFLETDAVDPVITPDGQSVLYRTTSPLTNLVTLNSVPVSGGTPVVLASSIVNAPIPSSDGTRVVFFVPNGTSNVDVDSIRTGGGTPVTLATVAAAANGVPAVFTPDSAQVVICSAAGLLLAPADGSAPAASITSGTTNCSELFMPPSGQQVVYELAGNQSKIYSVNLAASSTPTQIGSSSTPIQSALFSPDSRYLASYGASGSSLFPLAGGSSIPLVASPGTEATQPPAFTPDGLTVVWNAGVEIDKLVIATQTKTKLISWMGSSAAGGSPPLVSRDGQTVYVSTELTGNVLLAINLATATTTTLSSVSAGATLRPSPDGTHLAFAGFVGNELAAFVVPTSGSAAATPLLSLQPAGPGPIVVPMMSWFDDQTLLLVRSGTPEPYSVQDGLYKVPVP